MFETNDNVMHDQKHACLLAKKASIWISCEAVRVGVKRSRFLGFGSGGSQFYFAEAVRAIVLAACRGAVDSFSWSSGSCSKSYLRCGEEYRAPFHFGLWSCRLVKGPVSCSWKVVVVYSLRVHRGVAAVWWSQVCGFVRAAAVRSQVPAVHGCAPLFLVAALPLFQPSPFYFP
ncbi:hypothetical protein Bca4012_095937 [Brassica carinata]